ncbi:MAG: DUF6089 family protein [Runella sp.]
MGQTSPRWEISGGVGAVGYLGDLNQNRFWSRAFRSGAHAEAKRYLNDFLALRYRFQVGQFCGKDSYYPNRQSRNLSVEPLFIENALLLDWDWYNLNPLFYRQRYSAQAVFSPYLFTGIAVVYANPKPTFDQTLTPYTWIREGIAQDQNARYSKMHVAFPLGGGIKYDLSPDWIISAEASIRLTTTDYLDGVSMAGNPDRTDSYQMGTLTLTKRLGLKKKNIRKKW